MPLNPEKLRQLRRTAKLTQAELAERAGIAQTQISQLERGENPNPSVAILEKIAKVISRRGSVDALLMP